MFCQDYQEFLLQPASQIVRGPKSILRRLRDNACGRIHCGLPETLAQFDQVVDGDDAQHDEWH